MTDVMRLVFTLILVGSVAVTAVATTVLMVVMLRHMRTAREFLEITKGYAKLTALIAAENKQEIRRAAEEVKSTLAESERERG